VSQNPLWYKDAVFYGLHGKAVHDSNRDGIGDFNGLTSGSTTCTNSGSRRLTAAASWSSPSSSSTTPGGSGWPKSDW
jgi:hypothetical protein